MLLQGISLAQGHQKFEGSYTLEEKYLVAVGAPTNRANTTSLIDIKFNIPITIALSLDGPENPTSPTDPSWSINSGFRITEVVNGVHTVVSQSLKVEPLLSDWVYLLTESPQWFAHSGIAFAPLTLIV
jgi:hypothetical protein